MSDPDAARAQAQEILAERRFRGTDLPDPFAEPLRWLSARVQEVLDALDALVPGGRGLLWALLILAVAAAVFAVAARGIARRGGAAGAAGAGAAPAGEDPAALERRAREAAARGEHELALRLGFRAGVLRLGRPSSASTAEVARAVGTPEFGRAAARFDEVVYGRRAAGADDVEAARAAWADALTRDRR